MQLNMPLQLELEVGRQAAEIWSGKTQGTENEEKSGSVRWVTARSWEASNTIGQRDKAEPMNDTKKDSQKAGKKAP